MTKAERELAKKEARRNVIQSIDSCLARCSWSAPDFPFLSAEMRERARLYRIALRAVREEVRRGK